MRAPIVRGHPDLSTLERLCERLAVELPGDALPDLIAALEAAKTRALARVVQVAMPTPLPPAQLVNAVEMARRLGVAETWVRDSARRGRIPCVHAGVHLRFDPDAVLNAMKTGAAALPSRTALSQRGRRAVEHKIERPVEASKSADSLGAATTLLPPKSGERAKPV